MSKNSGDEPRWVKLLNSLLGRWAGSYVYTWLRPHKPHPGTNSDHNRGR